MALEGIRSTMGIEEVVNLQITSASVSPTRAGFGTPLCMAYHTVVPDVAKEYASNAEMVDDGFLVTDPAYRLVQKVFSQNPRPQKIILGKRVLAYTQTIELTPVKLTVGYVYRFTYVNHAGLATDISYTVVTNDTVNLICVALAALLDPLLDSAAVVSPAAPNATKVVITATAGKLINLKGLPKPGDLKVKDVTADPGIATDLAAVLAADPTTWYGICFDHTSKASAVAAAAWVEAIRRIAIVNTTDQECLDGAVTTDVASSLKAAAYVRTEALGSYSELLSYSAAAWLGKMLPKNPGSATWSFKTLAGVTVDVLTGGEKTQAKNKRLNTYTTVGGINVTQWGQSPDGGWIDIVIGTDWLFARISEAVYGMIQAADKVPYTDGGVDSIVNVILGVLGIAQKPAYGFLATTPAPTVTAPKVADVDTAEKTERNLPDVEFGATLAGAIHTVAIRGTLAP